MPVYAERGPQGGVSLLENYRTNLTGLTEGEVRALFTLTVPGLMEDLGAGDAAEQALLKLTAALPAPFQKDVERVRQRIHLDPAAWFTPEEPVPHLHLVQEAVWQAQRLRMLYRRGDGQWVKRLVDPYGLVAKASVWYMVAGSFHHPYVFRVSRIQEAELTGSQFQRPANFDLPAFWQSWSARLESTRERYAVTLYVPPEGLQPLAQLIGDGLYPLLEEAAPPDQDGCITLALTFESEEAAARQLIGLGTVVTVLNPPSLRQTISETAQQLVTHYK
ncbi:MAG: WYL domain-containing protein [Anaerolineales bacterium]|nr:WYL domain-containing protein [Anaerolineales bacterium]